MAYGDGKLLKYGPVKGVEHAGIPMSLEASQIFEPASAKFLTVDATSGNAGLTGASDTTIIGWCEVEAYTSSVGDKRNVILGNAPVVYRVPVKAALSGNVVQACVGDFCDLELNTVGTNTTFQTAAVGTTTRSLLIIVDFDATNGLWVDVICNPAKLGSN